MDIVIQFIATNIQNIHRCVYWAAKHNIWLVRHLIKPTWCRVTSVCIGGCILLLLVLLVATSSDSLAGDPMTSEPGNVLYWTPSSRPNRDTLLSPTFNFTNKSDEQLQDKWPMVTQSLLIYHSMPSDWMSKETNVINNIYIPTTVFCV
jgi:hypothetical protein